MLTGFFFDRGRAAALAGRTRQALGDLNTAAKYGEQAKSSDQSAILFELAGLEASMRRPVAASRLVRRAIELNPQQMRPRLIGYNGRLAGLLASTGDIAGAEKALAEAGSIAQQFTRGRGGTPPQIRALVSRLESSKGALAMARGRYVEAEEIARKALAEAQAQQLSQHLVSMARHALVNALRQQGRYGEAENEARLTLAEAQRARGASGSPVTSALSILTSVLIDQGRYREAEALARKSVEIILASGLTASGSVRSTLAAILAGQERWEEAAKQIDVLRDFYGADSEEFAAESARSPHIALIDLMTGQSARALGEFGRQVEIRRTHLGDRHFATAEARGLFGMALARTGRVAEARQQFEMAIPILTSRSREADDQDSSATARDQRLRMIIESYMRIQADSRDPNAAAETFRLAEAARGRSVVRALAESAARAAASDPSLADLARREQDVQRQIGALNGVLANAISARSEEQNPAAVAQLRQQIDTLRGERARAMEEIERRFPDYANLVNPKPATIEDARKGLRTGEALLATYSADDRTYVWAVPRQGAVGFVAATTGRAALDATVAGLRKALDPQAETLDDIPAFDLAAAHRLYAELLKPTEAVWSEAKSLVVVPHGPLGQISLGLLPTGPATAQRGRAEPFAEYRGVPWLIRKVAVVQLPSVSSLSTLRALPAGRADRTAFVGFGDPWFSKAHADEARAAAQIAMRGGKIRLRSAPKPTSELEAQLGQLPRLPETAEKVRSIAIALNGNVSRDVIVGAAANKGRIRQMDLSSYKVVMFATHGLVPGDLTGLAQPALALTSAEVAPEGGDGLLTMEEILGLKLDADWVVLSACNTASGQGAGAEAISGLGRAFFYAGTRSLLVSNWPVETSSAQKLTTDLFARQSSDPSLQRGEALRQAMLRLIDGPGAVDASGKTMFTYAHPIFWAAFTLVGDGGR
ncbi:MAG: CHAT domain-containing protein [Alphaproteobacteria bacterium]|nr:CHAT domain-containing protein [Alphaproteobacteria bacterium]